MALYRCFAKTRIIFTSILLVVAIAIGVGLSIASIDIINDDIEYDKYKMPKYTSMTLAEFLEDVKRYPDKWQDREVTLEIGRAHV